MMCTNTLHKTCMKPGKTSLLLVSRGRDWYPLLKLFSFCTVQYYFP